MRLSIYEGTPDEIAQVAASLPGLTSASTQTVFSSQGVDQTASEKKIDASSGSERRFVSVEIARDVLTRRRLSPEQLKVLRAIYEAHPRRVPATELQKLTKYTTAQFAGLMGAFGRRLSHTAGYIDDTYFIDNEWNYDLHYNEYSLPPSVREALKVEGLV